MSIYRNLSSRMEISLSTERCQFSDRRLHQMDADDAKAERGAYAPIPRLVDCPACHGTGVKTVDGVLYDDVCAPCEGSGSILR